MKLDEYICELIEPASNKRIELNFGARVNLRPTIARQVNSILLTDRILAIPHQVGQIQL
jgi:hypothetical protein